MRACSFCWSVYTDQALDFCGLDGTSLEETEEDPLVGKVLDRYQIVTFLGAGAMARVYRGKPTRIGREVAVKVLLGDFAGNDRQAARFRHEAQSMSEVVHPNIAAVHDFQTTRAGLTYLVMELVQGMTLAEAITQAPQGFDTRRAGKIARQIAAGLAAAHREGIVHRDLKPGNIMIVSSDGDETVKILDFGLAQVAESDERTVIGGQGGHARLTQTGFTMGTPLYMSPEQLRAEEVTPRADLYALGVVLYEMLVGHPPFGGNRIDEVVVKHCVDAPPPLPPRDGLERIAMTLLAKRVDERPERAEKVIAMIDALGLTGNGNAHRPMTPATPAPTGAPPRLASSPLAPPTGSFAQLEAAVRRESRSRITVALFVIVLFLLVIAATVIAWDPATVVEVTMLEGQSIPTNDTEPRPTPERVVIPAATPTTAPTAALPPPPSPTATTSEPVPTAPVDGGSDVPATTTAPSRPKAKAKIPTALRQQVDRALATHSLSLSETERIPATSAAAATWRRAVNVRDAETAKSAADAFTTALTGLRLDASVLAVKLRTVRTALDHPPSALSPDRYAALESTYADLEQAAGAGGLSDDVRARLFRQLVQLEQDIRAAHE